MKSFNLALLSLTLALAAQADEGMWLFNQPPRQILRERYQFDATDAWLEHLQKASVRFNSGGSGSFVSADGLLISNHHVGADALQKFSTPEKNYLETGFYARTQAEEIKCLDLELNVLQSIEDVTARVNAAVPADADAAAAFLARRKVIADIEKESLDRTGLRSDVVTLWQGGAYQSVSLQALHGRAAGVRAGTADRVLRRRPGQFRIPALRPRHLPVPRLRKRPAGQGRRIICAFRRPARAMATWFLCPAIPAARAGC